MRRPKGVHIVRYPEPAQGAKDALDHQWGRIEGVERGPLGGGVLIRREEGDELFTQCLPACVLVVAGQRIGKQGPRNGSEARKAGKALALRFCGGPASCLDRLEGFNRRDDVAGFLFFTARNTDGVFALGARQR